jgi:hypothetical protein
MVHGAQASCTAFCSSSTCSYICICITWAEVPPDRRLTSHLRTSCHIDYPEHLRTLDNAQSAWDCIWYPAHEHAGMWILQQAAWATGLGSLRLGKRVACGCVSSASVQRYGHLSSGSWFEDLCSLLPFITASMATWYQQQEQLLLSACLTTWIRLYSSTLDTPLASAG